MTERCVTFSCEGDTLIGILHEPHGTGHALGVVIVVGGPQYRVGSHRQFVVMARELAMAGYPVLRFDYRGMGDSTGETRTFEAIDADIGAAIDALFREFPGVRSVACYGLCDAASALLGYGYMDPRIRGLVLANPWARTESGEARAYVKHYYFRRLMQRSFWSKLIAGDVTVSTALRSAGEFLRKSVRGQDQASAQRRPCFLDRMRIGLQRTTAPVLLQISGVDLTAREFLDVAESSRAWRAAIRRENVSIERFHGADHTFSSSHHLGRSIDSALQWLNLIAIDARS